MPHEKRPNVNTHFALIDGKVVPYDMADTGKYQAPVDHPGWKYIGCGVVYSVGGVLQQGRIALHFWQRT